ncbi:hypothetical protein BKH41_09145 [Helicobacter sp. 12S02232-10]|uniref:VirB4 family type IV secretion/conjugal transfer ATPase n=1 Tax=Helicobacter sp. 12S02232-10 TaxID=1476197 RepID=UPI000BA74672|nr:hypothetical protein [Helicobacter sp. 12S02232-10]PAF46468.1 hypothetical protein BKH41_09145 [Helicobacter sp. 12S02232-10]
MRKKYSRFISVKSYKTDLIDSGLIPEILKENMDLYIMFHLQALDREKAFKKVHDSTLMAVNEEITLKLKSLEDEIKQEKENIFYFYFSILIQSESKEELDRNCSIIVNYLENKKNLSVAKESLNLKPLYFSFFPANGNLNARIRQQSGSIISVLINFENNILGFTKNSFGNKPVTI